MAGGPESLAAGSDEIRVKTGKAGATAPEIGMGIRNSSAGRLSE
jgi:hypothetical protein